MTRQKLRKNIKAEPSPPSLNHLWSQHSTSFPGSLHRDKALGTRLVSITQSWIAVIGLALWSQRSGQIEPQPSKQHRLSQASSPMLYIIQTPWHWINQDTCQPQVTKWNSQQQLLWGVRIMVLALKTFFITILQWWQAAFLFNSTGQNYPQPTYTYGAESWHSGYSPHRYELVTLPGNVKKCYGCGAEFTDRQRSPLHNIVVKHVDRRLVRRDERTGNFLFSADYSNTYYHLDFSHIQRKNPFFTGQVFIAFDKLSSLNNSQCNIIENCNLKVTVN